jgi:hypothetical protein
MELDAFQNWLRQVSACRRPFTYSCIANPIARPKAGSATRVERTTIWVSIDDDF